MAFGCLESRVNKRLLRGIEPRTGAVCHRLTPMATVILGHDVTRCDAEHAVDVSSFSTQ